MQKLQNIQWRYKKKRFTLKLRDKYVLVASILTQNKNFTLFILGFTIPEIKTPVPPNAGIKKIISVRLLSVLRGRSFFIPATTANDLWLRRIFYPKFYPLHLFSYFNSWERASIYPFECSVLNKDTTGTIFITSLVWRGLWLGIEPGTSLTRSQHYTTRLSRRRR